MNFSLFNTIKKHLYKIILKKPSIIGFFLLVLWKLILMSVMLFFFSVFQFYPLSYSLNPHFYSQYHLETIQSGNLIFSSDPEGENLVIITTFSLFNSNYTFHKVLSLCKKSILAVIWYFFSWSHNLLFSKKQFSDIKAYAFFIRDSIFFSDTNVSLLINP